MIPTGAIIEPFARNMFTNPSTMALPQQLSNVLAGAVLLVAGVVGAALTLAADRKSASVGRSL